MYRCTPQTSTQETSYNLACDTDAMIQVEVGEPSLRRQISDLSLNHESLSVEINLINELRDKRKIREVKRKLRAAKEYNSKV